MREARPDPKFPMNLSSYTLSIDEVATPKLIGEVISQLPNHEDPFATLAVDTYTYIQCLWTEDGFILEYQDGSIDRHYCSGDYLSSDAVIAALVQYHNNEDIWRTNIEFYRKNLRGFWGNLGYQIGCFIGSLTRGFKGSN